MSNDYSLSRTGVQNAIDQKRYREMMIRQKVRASYKHKSHEFLLAISAFFRVTLRYKLPFLDPRILGLLWFFFCSFARRAFVSNLFLIQNSKVASGIFRPESRRKLPRNIEIPGQKQLVVRNSQQKIPYLEPFQLSLW